MTFHLFKIGSVEATWRIRVESWSRVTAMWRIDCASRRVAQPFSEAEAAVGGKGPRGSRERAPDYVQCEPKDIDEVAHQQFPSNFAISFEDGLAQPRLRASETKASRSFRVVQLEAEASHIRGKLAREVKAADMNNHQAVIY